MNAQVTLMLRGVVLKKTQCIEILTKICFFIVQVIVVAIL